jgi:hypothetical protein
MSDHASQTTPAFRRLRRALFARRLRQLDPVLRLELAAIGGFVAGFCAWRARLPFDHLARFDGAAVVFASHVVETVERLRDRVVILHLGRIVRTLARAAWGGPDRGPSPLEREFLSVVQIPPAREGPA